MKKILKAAGLTFLGLLLLAACGESKKEKEDSLATEIDQALEMESPQTPESREAMKTVVDVALFDIEFSTLAKSLKNAELIDALQEMENITLFAPTNNGFEKLPEEKVADLLKPQGKSELIGILKYHVVKGNYDAYALREEMSKNDGFLTLETLQGTSVKIMDMEGELLLIDEMGDSAKIVKPNIRVDQGTVHGIDKVLLPN